MGRLVPWRLVADWRCLACGACCTRFRIPLRPDEAVSIARSIGEWAVEVRAGRPYLARVGGRCAFLSGDGRCLLHPLGLKPRACKVWPFSVSREPVHGLRDLARFEHLGRTWYVYADPRCPGLKLGEPGDRLRGEVIPEVVEIWAGVRTRQEASTSALPAEVGTTEIPSAPLVARGVVDLISGSGSHLGTSLARSWGGREARRSLRPPSGEGAMDLSPTPVTPPGGAAGRQRMRFPQRP